MSGAAGAEESGEGAGAWRPALPAGARPLYLAIAEALAEDIAAGRLRPGTRLPPQRALAAALGIDFTTVSRAYAEARRRGLLEGRVGQGTFVRPAAARVVAATPEVGPAARREGESWVDLSMNLPPRFEDAALSARLWSDIARLETEGGDELLLRYQEPGGTARDRAAGLAWLRARLPEVTSERLLLCPGVQGALLVLVNALAGPGETICTEALTYPGLRSLAAHLGVELIGLEMDAEGLKPEAFEAVCRRRPPRALYCTPTLHNPTTASLPRARRAALVAIARRYGVAIIEDAAYGALPTDPAPPLAALAPDLVYHVAGLSKCLSPALRIAYLVAPDARAALRLAGGLRATATMASPLTAAIATRWIEAGAADAVLRALRAETRRRQAIAAALLPAESLQADPEGFHLWLRLPAPWTRGEFAARLQAAGIGAVASDAFALGKPPEAVRLGLGAPGDCTALRQGLQAVAELLAQPPSLSSLVV